MVIESASDKYVSKLVFGISQQHFLIVNSFEFCAIFLNDDNINNEHMPFVLIVK